VTLVNIGLGVVTALVMWALGVPNPALWGVVAAILNYVPYAGAMLNVVILAVVGLLSFDELWRGMLPAAAFLGLTTLESDVLTPTMVGRRLTLPPMVVFLSLLVWGWIWGVAGALLAVPILVILKVAADYSETLRPLAPFLGGNVAPKLRGTGFKGTRR
ncbi:MAG TPA: AI-2E family transporter, partial [Candidatus Omnitrophota bacterium]|nr:AI-2E family transporter [Candidatus Omnitrophota bacterium]